MTKTETETVSLTAPSGFMPDTCTLCDAPATIVVTLTPDDFSSRCCHFCGGERSFCDTHWNEFVGEITRVGKRGE